MSVHAVLGKCQAGRSVARCRGSGRDSRLQLLWHASNEPRSIEAGLWLACGSQQTGCSVVHLLNPVQGGEALIDPWPPREALSPVASQPRRPGGKFIRRLMRLCRTPQARKGVVRSPRSATRFCTQSLEGTSSCRPRLLLYPNSSVSVAAGETEPIRDSLGGQAWPSGMGRAKDNITEHTLQSQDEHPVILNVTRRWRCEIIALESEARLGAVARAHPSAGRRCIGECLGQVKLEGLAHAAVGIDKRRGLALVDIAADRHSLFAF